MLGAAPPVLQGVGFRAPGAEWQDPHGFEKGQQARLERGYKARQKSLKRIEQSTQAARGYQQGDPVVPPGILRGGPALRKIGERQYPQSSTNS